jgi:hypothetical protein
MKFLIVLSPALQRDVTIVLIRIVQSIDDRTGFTAFFKENPDHQACEGIRQAVKRPVSVWT